jgi:arylsulfatase A-like enzyme
MFVVAPLLWLACGGVLCSALFAFSFFRRHTGAVCFVVGPSLLIAVRAVRPLTGSVNRALLVILFLAVVAIGILFAERASRLFLPAFGLIVGLGVITPFVCAGVDGSRTAPRLTAGRVLPRNDAPNVVVIFLDTLRADYTGLSAPSGAGMPHLQAFSRDSIIFTRAFAPASWTLPSHASVLTGVSVPDTGCSFEHQRIDTRAVTLAERFRAAGYRTTALFANAFLNPGSGLERGYDAFEYSERTLSILRTAPFVAIFGHIMAVDRLAFTRGSVISARAVNALKDEGRPQFITLNYMDAHMPYFFHDEEGKLRGITFRDRKAFVEHQRTGRPISAEEVRRLQMMYREAIRELDGDLAPILDAVRRTRRPTIVAVVGDHGEQFGGHNLLGHGNSLYAQLLAVPLILRVPSLPPAAITTPVSTTLLYDTLLAVSGVQRVQTTLLSTTTPRTPVISYAQESHSPVKHRASIVSDHFHLIAGRRTEFFDIDADPSEEHDLSNDPSQAPTRDRLLSELRRFANDAPANSSTARAIRSFGYFQ